MCGICGKFSLEAKQSVNSSLIEQMSNVLTHRGPDDAGFLVDKEGGLGFRRLSIIDLSQAGHQPMSNEDDSVWIVFNGEIYNYQDLRNDLIVKGHQFKSRTDTEVILHLYEEYGPTCVEKLNGMFAFAIWDKPRRKLMLARDRLGIKPLYYTYRNGTLWFASEIKSILADPDIPRSINPRGLVNYVTYGHAVAPETMYQDIFKLLPGHILLYDAQGVKLSQYWQVPSFQPGKDRGEDYYVEQLKALLTDSVRVRLMSDVPLGVFLSGGVDSSAIVGLMSQQVSNPVKTFSLGFEFGGIYNELADARVVAQCFATDHHEFVVESPDLLNTIETLVWHYDEPFGDPAAFPVYLLSKFAREHVTVVLTGEGGDELFGGYRRQAAEQFAAWYQTIPAPARSFLGKKVIGSLPRLRRAKTLLNVLHIEDDPSRLSAWHAVFEPSMCAALLAEPWLEEVNGYSPTSIYEQLYNLEMNSLDNKLYSDLAVYLPDTFLEKTDKATMAVSLEARVPILDHRLVEFACAIPTKYKLSGTKLKKVFRKAVSDLLPESIINKPKRGFAVPLDYWFRGSLRAFAQDVLLDHKTRTRGYFDQSYVDRLLTEHQNGQEVRDEHLWLLINFELWHRQFIDG